MQAHFHFRTDAEGNKRDSLSLDLPIPSYDDLINILEEKGKAYELLQEAMLAVVMKEAKPIVDADTSISADTFPYDKVAWATIANKPKTVSRIAISKEDWDAFFSDYLDVMPEATGKTVEQVQNMIKILAAKLNPVKTNEPVLDLVLSQLAVYLGSSSSAADHVQCVNFLVDKANSFKNVTPEELLSAL